MEKDLKAILASKKIRQRALAEALGLSEAAVSAYCAAHKAGRYDKLPAERAVAIAKFLKVPRSAIRPDLWLKR